MQMRNANKCWQTLPRTPTCDVNRAWQRHGWSCCCCCGRCTRPTQQALQQCGASCCFGCCLRWRGHSCTCRLLLQQLGRQQLHGSKGCRGSRTGRGCRCRRRAAVDLDAGKQACDVVAASCCCCLSYRLGLHLRCSLPVGLLGGQRQAHARPLLRHRYLPVPETVIATAGLGRFTLKCG